MINRQLVMPPRLWSSITSHLFTHDQAENFCLGVARPCRRGSGVGYILEALANLGKEDLYEQRSGSGLTISRGASNKANRIARDAAQHGRIPVHFHSHPPGCDRFSGYDDQHEAELHEWLRDAGQPLLASVIFPYHGRPTGRLWTGGEAEDLPLRHGLQPITGYPEQTVEALDRQRAFGPALAAAAASLRVAIVGLGGIGMLVAEQLARCGMRNFVLVDHDDVELSNLNRLGGTFDDDIGRKKVSVAHRLIHRSARSLGITPQVQCFAEDINDAPRRVFEMVRHADVILALTDDQLSRLRCLRAAFEGGAEYLSAAVDIRIGNGGDVTGLFAEIVSGEAGRICPVCCGRLNPAEASIEARRYVNEHVAQDAVRRGYLPDVAAPAVMSLNSTAAGMLVLELQRRIAGLGYRDVMQVDWQTGVCQPIQQADQYLEESCAVCGRESVPASSTAGAGSESATRQS